MSNKREDKLVTLFDVVADHMLTRIKNGEATDKLVEIATKFLNQNGVNADLSDPEQADTPGGQLAALPFLPTPESEVEDGEAA